MKGTRSILLLVIALVAVFFIGRCSAPGDLTSGEHASSHHAHTAESGEGASEYICPMHPQVRQPEFGTCPICFMDLVPLSSGGENSVIDIAQFSEASTALLAIETAHVKREVLKRRVRTFGEVVSASSADARVSSWANGRVERLYVTDIGASVKPGDRIARIWSPELASLVQTLREAATLPASVARSVSTGAKQQLLNAGLSEREIDELVRSNEASPRITLRAKSAGVVTERHIREGDYVSEGAPILTLNTTSKLWAELQVLEHDASTLEIGQKVHLTTREGRVLPEAKISFIAPNIDPSTRSLSVRVEWDAGADSPRVGARVYGEIESESPRPLLAVAREAILWTGERSLVFIVDRSAASPIYQPTEVEVGERWGNSVEILSGLYPGEEIVSEGAFRIDASIYLRSGGGMLRERGAVQEVNHEH